MTTMVRVPPRRPMLRGIDVSKWQGKIDWKKVSTSINSLGLDGGHADVGFAFIRAAYGTKIDRTRDKTWGFVENWDECRSAGIIRGCYQYMTDKKPGDVQADALVEIIEANGGLNPDDLPPVLDVEDKALDRGTLLKNVLAWCKRIEDRLDRVPIIYTYPSFWENRIVEPMRYPLWISHVKTEAPLVPTSWQTWMFWQDSWSGVVPGIKGKVDTCLFEGSKGVLVNYASVLIPGTYEAMTRKGT